MDQQLASGFQSHMQVANFERITINLNQIVGVPCALAMRFPVEIVLRMPERNRGEAGVPPSAGFSDHVVEHKRNTL
jgi:hypothetical protein